VLRVVDPTDRGLPTCERSASFRTTLAVIFSVQSGTLHIECICVGRDAVALLCCDLFLIDLARAASIYQWHDRGWELSMITILIHIIISDIFLDVMIILLQRNSYKSKEKQAQN
jgi:hypothetical protein